MMDLDLREILDPLSCEAEFTRRPRTGKNGFWSFSETKVSRLQGRNPG